MDKRGFITALIIVIIAGSLVFSVIYLSLQRTERAQENFKNITNSTKITPSDSTNKSSCISNSDCVPASCCHSSKCISKDKAPNCEGAFCTMECAPNSLDCGQGNCACVNNRCEAIFR